MGDDVPCRRWFVKCFWEWLFSYFVYFSCVRKSWWRREYISMIINHELPFETVPVIIHGQYTSSRTSNVEASGTLQGRRTYTIVQHITDAWHRLGSELSQSWAPWLEIWGKLLPTLNLPPTRRGSAGRGRQGVAAVSNGAPPPRTSPPRGSARDRI